MLATWLASVLLITGLVSATSEGKDERYTYNQMCIVERKLTVLHGKLIYCFQMLVGTNEVNRTYHQLTGLIDGYEARPITPGITYEMHPILAVVDYNKFKPNETLPEYGLFYVLEQMPGTIVYQDLTWFLQKYSYFPSYNIPYFKKITDISGFVNQGKKLGDWFVWGKSPRAKIFERDHHTVTDLDSLTKLMRYNNYTKDEFSRCNCNPPYSAEAAVSARGDLNPANGTYEFPGQGHVNHGALDYKGTNVNMMKKLEFRAQGGPTWGTVPPFRWSTFDF
ncbi:lysophospholipase, partial [Teladorsagia circumcincta]